MSSSTAEMEEKLREAACFGDLEGLLTLVNQGAEVNSQHKVNGWTALHWASKRNNLQCVEALLARGADKMLYTSKGELAAHLTTNKGVLQTLGYSGQHTRDRQRGVAKKRTTAQQQAAEVESNASCSSPVPPPFVPNYLRHPQLNYKVDLSHAVNAKQQQQQQQQLVSPQQVTKAKSANNLDDGPPSSYSPAPSAPVRILKVRLSGRDEYDRDFIELDLPPQRLTFRGLVDAVCEEFSIDPKIVVKIRKLPNTRMRRDVEVQRLTDYQELEIETTAPPAPPAAMTTTNSTASTGQDSASSSKKVVPNNTSAAKEGGGAEVEATQPKSQTSKPPPATKTATAT